MKLTNHTKNKVVADKVRHARTMGDRTKGLIGTHTPYALAMRTRFGIHTFGMKYPIDCAVLDSAMCVVAMRHAIPVNDFYFWNPKYSLIVELPAGSLLMTDTQIGDILSFDEEA